MNRKLYPAIGAVIVALLVASMATLASGASSSKVTVRVEGLSRTLLPPKTVTAHPGWITRFGAPTGRCPETSAAGALDVATKHGWGGKFESSFGDYEITSILGETHTFTSKDFWEIFVNNVAASAGACASPLRPGEQLLFAAVPQKGTEYPMAIKAPSAATVGHPFDVEVVWFNAKGKAEPLAGATVSVAGRSGKTNGHGVVPLTPSHPGTFVLTADRAGYIRAVPATVHVS
jgi:hypothetical protein